MSPSRRPLRGEEVDEAVRRAPAWDVLVSEEEVRSGVSGGVVTREGAVRSWAEKRAFLGAVGHAPGVRKVHDRLYVEPEL